MVCFLTDGTEHAVQEGLGLCAHMVNSVEGKPRPAWSVGLKPVGETCGIHGLALEENGGITAAMPGEYHTHGALLLWEIVAASEGGRPDEYRGIWVADLRHLDVTLLPLPVHLFDKYLAALTKATTSKWEISALASRQTLMLLEPPESRVPGSRTMLEIFLAKCRLVMCGNLDDAKTKRVVHPHVLKNKIDLLSGIIHLMEFEANWQLPAAGRLPPELHGRLVHLCQEQLGVQWL